MKNVGRGRATRGKRGLNEDAQTFRSEFGERLRWLLDLFSTRSEAAAVAGVNPDQLGLYVRGDSKAPLEVIYRLCKAKSVSIGWLTSGEGQREHGEVREGTSPVPLFDVRAGAGAYQLAHSEDAAQYVYLDDAFLFSLGVKPENAGLLIADGPSMRETIDHGEMVLFDKSEIEPREAIFIVRRGDGVQVKRLQRRAEGSLALISDNPAFPPEDLRQNEASDLKLIGRVKFVFRRL